MEKGGFKRLGRLFHHRSESEDSEPDLGKDTPVSSPCPSPCLEGRREHRGSCSSTTTTTTVSGERKKRSPFGHWRLKKKQQQSKDEEAAGDNAVLSSLFASSFDASEPTTPTNSYFDMPDLQYATQEKQQPLVPIQNSQYAYGISVDSISSSTLPSSFRKSKTRSSESSKELKKKAVLGKFGHFFTTGRRKNPKNTQETSSKPSIKIIRPESPHKNLAPLASIEIEDLNDLSKSEESLTDSIYEQNQSKTRDTIDNSEDYLYNRDLTPLYNDIVSEWNTKGLSSGSELSLDWHSSNETLKNTLFDSNLTLGTLEGENELVTDTNTTPDFFKSLSTLSDENLEQIILNHKELVEPLTFAESEYAESKDQLFFVEPKQDEQPQPSRILTLDIFLRRAEQQNLNKPVAVALDNDCSNTDIMDKKPAIRKSGKRRKSQSSSDVPNGDRNASENTVKEEPGFDGIPSDMVSEKISTSERKVRLCQQIMSPTNNNDIRSGSNHKGFTKSELEKCKQQSPASSPYKKKSFKKNQSDAGPLSPIGIKSPGKNPSAKRQSDGIMDGNPTSTCTSVEELPSDDNIVVSPVGIVSNSSSQSPSEERTESQDLHPVRSSDGTVILQADKHKNDEVEGNRRQISSDLDEAKPRNICLDVSRTVTTKVSLPAKPKNVELNLKASKSLENLANEQDATDKVKINFSIANKISMFESKQNNQHQSADAPAPKRGSVSNTFVGRAKLKFGRQQTESEQTNKITNKGNHRQKLLQNGTKVKEISSDTKIKAQGKIEANITCDDVKKSEELGKVVKCQVNENDKVDGTKVNDSTFTKIDTELVKDKDLDNVSSIVQNEEIETNNWSMNATSLSPESEETFSLSSDHYFPNNNDKSLPQPDPTPQTSELNQISQFENKDQKVINTVLEDNQEFEQNNSWQENQSSGCNVSESRSTDGICDSPSDMAKFTETLKNLDSSVCIPQKKKKQKLPKSPAPHFAMPPIHEDKLEKIFDPNIFTVGLGIKRDRSQDLTPSVQLKLQSLETDARIRPKRASAENSLLLQSLKLPSRADSALMQEMNGKENKDSTDGDIKRSRLENSTIFSSLLAPTTKEKMFTPSVTTVNTITTSFASQKNATSPGIPPLIFDVTQKSEPLPGFKAPNYMDKYLQTDDAKRERILQMPNFGSLENSFSNWLKPGQCESNEFLAIETFSGKNQNKTNPRPGKVMICNKSDASENSFEVFHDVLDCTSWKLSPVILVKVIRGCWILYEKPNFEGVSIPMEEGELEFSNLWGEEAFDNEDTCKDPEPIVIGSIRHVVKDYRICRIDLFTEPQGLGLVNAYFDDTEETRLGSSQKTCSIQVSWGIWLLYEEPGYQGIPLMLEPGEYPDLSCWEKKEAYIRSLKPLKMGGRKVEYPKSRKVIVYEKPFFEGKHIELDSELTALAKEGDRTEESEELENELLTSIGSIKVKAGIWVAYEKPEFEGHQYLLEEGEYHEWTDWGGYDEKLQSLRPVLGDLMHPHMIMYTEKDFGNKGSSINVLGIISNLKDTGYGLRTQSVNVISGVWVAYENPDFTGEQYILDKGMYPSCEAWGAKNNKISSVQPILLDIINDHVGNFKVQLFSEPEFQGSSQILEKDVSQIVEFHAKSSKVLSGSWIAYDKENFSGNQYVLEEGAYPDLSAMGCLPQTCLKSLQVINIELSEPVITLFEKENFRGKKFEFITEIVNLQFLGYNPHVASVEVHGGIWIIYEHHNYKGHQILLTPKKISNWKETSSFHKIGSLRPLLQKQVYFRLRNKETGKFMAADGNMDDLSLLRIQAVEDNKSGDQIWLYQDGFIKCRGAEDICLTIVGNLITPGTKLGLALQQNDEKQNWSFHSDGKIYSKMKPNLVLDIKEGKQYDQNHLILSTVSEDRPTQCWEPLII